MSTHSLVAEKVTDNSVLASYKAIVEDLYIRPLALSTSCGFDAVDLMDNVEDIVNSELFQSLKTGDVITINISRPGH